MPAAFYKYIYQEENFIYLNWKKRFAAMGIWNNYWTFKAKWKNYMCYWKITFLSSKIFFYMVILMYTLRYTVLPIEKTSIWKVYFILHLKPTKTKKLNIWEKKPKITKLNTKKQNLWTKPEKIADFNEAEEKEVKEWVEIRKIKRTEVAEKKQPLKKRKKTTEDKKTRKEM